MIKFGKFNKSHQKTPRIQLAVTEAEPELGLNAAQVQERIEKGWANEPVDSPTKSIGTIVRENTLTYFNLIFIILAVLLVLVGSYKNMLFLLIAAANTIIGIIQQIRSKCTVDKLNLLAAPHTSVVREGSLLTIPTAELVRDDIVEFASGNQISADAIVLSGSVQVNESLITGEADAIEKSSGADLLSGSFIVAGRCRARLTHVGADSYAARLTLEAKTDVKFGRSEMMASLDKLIKVIGILLIPIGAVLFLKQYHFMEIGMHDSVVSTVAALIGMIPEGLYLLTSVALAVSVIRLAQHKTLVQEMSCIETLARVDVLCVDKTGTITEPQMQAGEVVLLNEEQYPLSAAETILAAFYTAADADNDTAKAMKTRFAAKTDWKCEKTIPFQSSTKWSAVIFENRGSYLVGAPEFVLGERYAEIQDKIEPYSVKGYRVLLLAHYDGTADIKELDRTKLTPVASILLANKIRETAPETFRYFAEQGVHIKVISGDNPLTVAEVARQAGIENAEHFVDAAELKTDNDIENAAEKYTVFGRVTPDQKRKLVRALQKANHTVAMTGDGVNDVLALKDADCGIAMASGSEAACQAAQLVLLNSDFSNMPLVVAEGRRVINNIQRAASLFLVKNIFSFFLSFITLFTVFTYPFSPIQLSLVSALAIGVPSFFLALEPNYSLVKGKFMNNVMRAAFPGAITNLFIIVGLEIFCFAFGFSVDERSTLCTLLMSFIGLLVLFQVCKPFDLKRRILWGTMAAAMLIAVTVYSDLFSFTPLNLQTGIALILFLMLSYPVFRSILWLFNKGDALYLTLRAKRKTSKQA